MDVTGVQKISGVAINFDAQPKVPSQKTQDEQKSLLKDLREAVREVAPQELEAAASDVQIQMKRLNTELKFEIDRSSGQMIVKIIDNESEEVIRQIPPKELLAIRERMQELIGVLFDTNT